MFQRLIYEFQIPGGITTENSKKGSSYLCFGYHVKLETIFAIIVIHLFISDQCQNWLFRLTTLGIVKFKIINAFT